MCGVCTHVCFAGVSAQVRWPGVELVSLVSCHTIFQSDCALHSPTAMAIRGWLLRSLPLSPLL